MGTTTFCELVTVAEIRDPGFGVLKEPALHIQWLVGDLAERASGRCPSSKRSLLGFKHRGTTDRSAAELVTNFAKRGLLWLNFLEISRDQVY